MPCTGIFSFHIVMDGLDQDQAGPVLAVDPVHAPAQVGAEPHHAASLRGRPGVHALPHLCAPGQGAPVAVISCCTEFDASCAS